MNREEYEQYQMLLTALENSPTIHKVRKIFYNLGVTARFLIPLAVQYWFYTITNDFHGVFWGYIVCAIVYFVIIYLKTFFSIEEEEEEDLNKVI